MYVAKWRAFSARLLHLWQIFGTPCHFSSRFGGRGFLQYGVAHFDGSFFLRGRFAFVRGACTRRVTVRFSCGAWPAVCASFRGRGPWCP